MYRYTSIPWYDIKTFDELIIDTVHNANAPSSITNYSERKKIEHLHRSAFLIFHVKSSVTIFLSKSHIIR